MRFLRVLAIFPVIAFAQDSHIGLVPGALDAMRRAQFQFQNPGRNQAQNQPPGNATISGIVVDAISHQPLKRATVSLAFIAGTGGAGQQQAAPAVTDFSGAFTFNGLQPGSYRLIVNKPDYPQSRGSPAKTISATASQNAAPITVEMVPPAAVSGQILDEDGDPMNGCGVQLHPAEKPGDTVYFQGMRNQDDRSDFRIFSIPPGKYLLSAHCESAAFQARPFSSGPDPPPSLAYPDQYYPVATDVTGGEVVELTAGSERGGLDFHMRTAHVTQVHVFLAPADLDARAMNFQLRLIPTNSSTQPGAFFQGAGGGAGKKDFELRRVFPGSYLIVASTLGPQNAIGGIERVEVRDEPVNVRLEMKPSVELSGIVEVETGSAADTSGNPANNQSASPNQRQIPMNIQLAAEYPGYAGRDQLLPPAGTSIKEDGSFTMQVLPGQWHLLLNGPAFLKAATLGGKDVAGQVIDLTGGAPGELRILASRNTATIHGTAPSGMTVAVFDPEGSATLRPTRFAMSDQSGQFQFPGLTPGHYRIAAVDSPGDMLDKSGIDITVAEGETATIELKPEPVTP